jgi:hypothetical protein
MSDTPSLAPWPVAPKPITLDEALLTWDAAKKSLELAKEAEMEARKVAFGLGFGTDAKEGTNTLELGNGYALKGVKKLNYKLKAPEGYKGTTVDAIDDTTEAFARISNEGEFIAERLFKYSVEMSVTEYRKLVEEADYSPVKKALLTELNKVLEISEGAPTLEIKEPKKK